MLERETEITPIANFELDSAVGWAGGARVHKIVMIVLGFWICSTAFFYFLWFTQQFYYANRSAIDRVIG